MFKSKYDEFQDLRDWKGYYKYLIQCLDSEKLHDTKNYRLWENKLKETH